MCQHNAWGHAHATDEQCRKIASDLVDHSFQVIRPQLVECVRLFVAVPVSPRSFMQLELALLVVLRSLGQTLVQAVVQSLEPDDAGVLPREMFFQGGGYRLRGDKTRNPHLLTLFGRITLCRWGYRSWQAGETGLFPLELLLGFTEGVSPALTSLIGRSLASGGMSQNAVVQMLRQQCGVTIGIKRLRRLSQVFSEAMSELRQAPQVDALLEAVRQAQQSRGSRKPVLSVGRDGITLREYRYRFFEVATAATVSVYDRSGKRIHTVYLAWPPELGQATMDRMLTDLLKEFFQRLEGPLPRLAYVTDSGSNETSYFQQVLRRMKHPHSGKRLKWLRVVDYYHASERVWAMAGALFQKNQEQQKNAWARRMLKNLKKQGGASRVLHSAASLYHRRKLGKTRQAAFWKGYRYLQKRTKHLRYAEYRSAHIPIGSGVTEAACKTIFTQRLKLSGMRWTFEGAKTILGLRTILLSGTWDQTMGRYLQQITPLEMRPYEPNSRKHLKIAA